MLFEADTSPWMGATKLFGNLWLFPLAINSPTTAAAAQPKLPMIKEEKDVEIIVSVPIAGQASKSLSLLDATDKSASLSAVAQPKLPTITEEKHWEIIKSVPIASPASKSLSQLDATDKPASFSAATPSVPQNLELPVITPCKKHDTPQAATALVIVPAAQASTTAALVSPALNPEEYNMTCNAESAWQACTNHSGIHYFDNLVTAELDKPSFADDSLLLQGLVRHSLLQIDWHPGRPPPPFIDR